MSGLSRKLVNAMGLTSIENLGYSANERLERAINAVERPGDYCTYGKVVCVLPRLEVAPVGTIAFPVQAAQIASLIEAADRAPYGRGSETVLDTSVRDCWQIDAAKFEVGGGRWEDSFGSILDKVAVGLGLPREGIEAQPYKLLVYERGGFFTPHRDSEKAEGMVATLVIGLPCDSTGGELVVRHADRETTIDVSVRDPWELAYAAFYADCRHETLPVSSGHRISLVYNVTVRAGSRKSVPTSAPDPFTFVESTAKLLQDWDREEGAANKVVWLLDHDYSQAGLSFDALKGVDAAVGRMLASAAERAGCALHAAILHIEEHGMPADYDFDWGWRGPSPAERVEIGEVFDWDLWLDSWVDPGGARPALGRLPLGEGELLPLDCLEDAEPDEQSVHEASGNEGVDVTHRYRRAALVIWPWKHTLKNIAAASISAAIDRAAEEFRNPGRLLEAVDSPAQLLAQLREAWPAKQRYNEKEQAENRRKMLNILGAVSDVEETVRFLNATVMDAYDGKENEALARLLGDLGPRVTGGFLPRLVKAQILWHASPVIDLLARLGADRPVADNPAWRETHAEAVLVALKELPEAFQSRKRPDALEWHSPEPPQVLKADSISSLFRLAWDLGLHREAEAAALVVRRHPDSVTPERALPDALVKLKKADADLTAIPSFGTLWLHASDSLLARSATSPEVPRDWFIDATLPCKCGYCADLRRFCEDRLAETARFALREDLRNHLSNEIRRAGLDISFTTERRGRPYTLVCTKTRASYHRRLREYDKDVKQMRRLTVASPSGASAETSATTLERLRKALEIGKEHALGSRRRLSGA